MLSAISNTYKKWKERSNYPNIGYYIQNMDKFIKTEYVPTNEDILQAKHKTCGVISTKLKVFI